MRLSVFRLRTYIYNIFSHTTTAYSYCLFKSISAVHGGMCRDCTYTHKQKREQKGKQTKNKEIHTHAKQQCNWCCVLLLLCIGCLCFLFGYCGWFGLYMCTALCGTHKLLFLDICLEATVTEFGWCIDKFEFNLLEGSTFGLWDEWFT